MLEFLFGAPGVGKTGYMVEEIKKSVKEGKKTFFLVPEQQLFVSECMLADLPLSSALCFEVISFSRLCDSVFGKYGGLCDSSSGSGIRQVIMLQSLRELSGMLSHYKGVKVDQAFTSMMISTIDELRENGISPEALETAAEKCEEPTLREKLSDLALIYANYKRNTEERLGESAALAQDKLYRLASLLSEKDFFKDTRVFIDSFTSFSGEEYAILKEMICQAERVCISFQYTRGEHAPHTYTHMQTVRRLTRFANENGIVHKDTVLLENKRSKSLEIKALEKNLWDFSLRKGSLPNIPEDRRGDIIMTEAVNEYEEIYAAALNILREHERGIHFSEMAVITHDADSRKGLVDAVFEELGIPYFYSEKTDLSTTPVSRLILSALRCITYNFALSDVLTLLKTGLLNIDSHDSDLFEEYLYTWNINGKQFSLDAWSMNPDGYTTSQSERGREILEAANRVKNIIIPPLIKLKQSFAASGGDTVENCRAIYSYLEEISLSDTLSSSAEFSLSQGSIKEAGELLRLYDFLLSALSDICSVMANTLTTAEELAAIIEIMLKNTDIGSVPAVNDYVTVGSAITLRVENIKTAFLLGLCEGEFPAPFSDGTILSENDKSVMDTLGLSLSSREESISSDELFYVWHAMTKPSQRLYLSYAASSIGGRAQDPSSAWNRVAFLFPYIKQNEFDLSRIRKIARAAEGKQDKVCESSDSRTESNGTSDAVSIDPFYVRMIFGDRLRLSKSQISTFAECPYRYWCEYVLKLREQKVASVSYADSGTIIHYVLEKLLGRLRLGDGRLEKISDEELISLVENILKEYISGIECPLPPSLMYSFSRLRDLSLIMSKSVLDEFENSDFRIVAMEQPISDRSSSALSPMEIRIGDDECSPVVSLGGIIDRIDCYENGERRYLRIVDYKTGSHKYDVSKTSTGEDLQLPAYLFTAALESNKGFFADGDDKMEIFPAAALFLSAEESGGMISPVRSGFMLNDNELLRAASANMDPKILAGISFNKDGVTKSRAALSEEGINEVNSTLQKTIGETARNMYSGRAPRTPSKEACKFCTLRSSCPVASKD